jgi:hypothetical protein
VPCRDDPPFLTDAARELRAIADRVPEIAGDLRDLADDLDAKAKPSISRPGALLAASPFGRMFRRLQP